MSDETGPTLEQVLSISDPGEVDRHLHGPIDRLVINVGNVVSWAFPLLMIAIVAQVFLRGSGVNQAWLDDAQWWIYGFAMLTAFGYAITTSSHVRVDILHQNFSEKRKARIEVFAIGWLLIPFIALMTDVMLHYAYASVIAGEGSSSPNGLHRVYLLKVTMPILFALAGLAAWAVFRRNLNVFTNAGLDKIIIWALPSAIFIGWRLVHYATYWIIYLTNSEINPRRITKEPIFDNALYISIAIVVVLFVFGYLRNRKKAS
jgi:TRAP-type mannitol/chloroaromatic compound transport system permease small subunit